MCPGSKEPAEPGTENVRLTGWGALSEAGAEYPDILQKASVMLVGDTECNDGLQAVDPSAFIFEDLELCASAQPSDSCYGDSGGPLTIGAGSEALLAGVVSWGLECAGPAPGIYAEVPAVIDWITTNARGPLTGTTSTQVPPPVDPPSTLTETPVPPSGDDMCNGMTVTVNLANGDLPTAGIQGRR